MSATLQSKSEFLDEYTKLLTKRCMESCFSKETNGVQKECLDNCYYKFVESTGIVFRELRDQTIKSHTEHGLRLFPRESHLTSGVYTPWLFQYFLDHDFFVERDRMTGKSR
jgi:Tim10/DDP family zinc finger